MDDFGIDLDKVLDDFELSEGGSCLTKPEAKHNHSNNLPTLQPPASAGNAYTSPQGAPRPPVYTADSNSNSNYRQLSPFTEYSMPYETPAHLSDYAVAPPQNTVIHTTMEPDRSGEVMPTSKPHPPGQLDLQVASISLTQLQQHHDNQWINNNSMVPSYQYPTGVLAHGERSNMLRRLSDDRPELLQSMQEKPAVMSPYLGNVATIGQLAYPAGVVVSHARPDVVPVSLNSLVDMVSHRSASTQPRSLDLGVSNSSPNDVQMSDPSNSKPVSDSQVMSFSNGDLISSLSPQDIPQKSLSSPGLQSVASVTPSSQQDIPTIGTQQKLLSEHPKDPKDPKEQGLQQVMPQNALLHHQGVVQNAMPQVTQQQTILQQVTHQQTTSQLMQQQTTQQVMQQQIMQQVTQETTQQPIQQLTQQQTMPPQQQSAQQTQQPSSQEWTVIQGMQPLSPGLSRQSMLPQGLTLSLSFPSSESPAPVEQEDMKVDSASDTLQSDQDARQMTPAMDAKQEESIVLDSCTEERLGQSTPEHKHTQPEMVPESNQSSTSVSLQLAPGVSESDSQSEVLTVGFGDVDGEDMSDNDIDAYLNTIADADDAAAADGEAAASAPSPVRKITAAATPSSLQFGSSSDSNLLHREKPGKATDFPNHSDAQVTTGNVEKFLALYVPTPRIATPMEDAGFSKVPGYMPTSGMSRMVEALVEEEGEESEACGGTGDAGGSSGVEEVEQTNCHQSNAAGITSAPMSVTTPPEDMSEHVQSMPQIETDCVITMEQSKGDMAHMTTGLEAITVSFPIHDASQPMDTNTGERPETAKSMVGSGARPKESSIQRKSRPNSLFGLSKPDLNITVPVSIVLDSGFGEVAGSQMVENTHDIINRQLAQRARSPLQKKQLNLEIKQHLDNARQMGSSSVECQQVSNGAASCAVAGVSVVTNRAQLASGVGFNLPSEGGATTQHGEDPAGGDDVMSSSSSSSLLSVQQTPSPARGAHKNASAPPPPPLPPPPPPIEGATPTTQVWPKQREEEAGERQEELGAEGECEQGAATKLKRPTSLNLILRTDFQVGGDKESTEDDALPCDGDHASSGSSGGHLTPFTAQHEMDDAAGAMASAGAEFYSPPEVGPGAFSPAPRCSSNVNVALTQLGRVAPRWVPDAEACNCMQCEARFTFTKRRHHCRACGKVFCSACCNLKCKLQYMDNKEARVCSKCYQDIVRAQAYERMHSPNRSPNPNNPAEYCSTVPPLQQAASSLHAPPPVVMVPVGVLRKEGSQRSREPKQVMFSDGIRPGGDLTELDGSNTRLPLRRHTRSSKKVERLAAAAATESSSEDTSSKSPSPKMRVKRLPEASQRPACLIPEVGLPPVIMSTGVKGDFTLEEDPNPESMMPKIRSTEDPNPVVFAINKNLFVLVKIVNLDCCLNRVCWCFSTKGMCTVGQDEVVLVLECLPDEKTVPRDIFCHLNSVYNEASKGNTVSHLGHTIFGQSFLGSRDHCGFLYVRPTFQCVQKLLLPQPPYVFGLLLQKWETPWAKVFPVRLMLRLGAEYRYYPCPLISVRFRKPVYGEIGHTIMNLLADFRNYQYMLPQIRGVVVHMEEKKTFIKFPRNRYDEVMKVITNSNDHVMALGANFSTGADSHLVCIQNEDGNYQTQAINIQNKPRKVTGASFVVFNGALKASSGLRAKSSIVEDGLMVQITSEAMGKLKAALLDMKDYTISCGTLDQPAPDEQVIMQWVEDDHKVNQGVKSPIDGLPMDGVESIHIHNATDYVGETRTIRWTEVFFIQNEDAGTSRGEPVDLSRLAETLAGACCVALTPHLDKLREAGLVKLGLRCTIDRDRVGYEVGANSERLPDSYMNDLDNELIPVIHNAGSQSQDGPVVLELIFYIIE